MATFDKIGFYLMLCMILSSCEFKCSVGKDASEKDKPKTSSSKVITNEGTELTNDISLDAHGLKVKKATLVFTDGSKVPEGNLVDLNTNIKAKFFIEDGWKTKNSRVFIGASETIRNDQGKIMLEVDDLFKDGYSTGVDPEQAKLVTLSAIAYNETTNTKYYIVNFRIWDKIGDGEIVGYYKFYIRH